MTTPTSFAASLVVAASLALPGAAIGQAVPRGGNGGSSEPASSPSAPARTRTASPASQPAPSTRSVSSRTRGTSETSAARSTASAPILEPAGRSRGVRAAERTARPRPPYVGPGGSTNSYYYGPSSYPGYVGYYPYYPRPAYGFHVSVGFGYGYASAYSPYGYAPYYGLYPYDPFFYGYGPYYYRPYGYGFYTSYQSSASDGGGHDNAHPADIQTATGSLRLRVSPASAKVYIDGALAGTVDDFDGLTGHLKVAAGTHELELRADGYRPYAVSITIDAGKTRTERASLKKI